MRARTLVRPVDDLSDRARRTREKLKAATRALLNEIGFHRIRVHDITERAGVAAGLFYRYFHEQREIAHEICQDFMDELNARTRKLPTLVHPYDQIYQRHLLAVEIFSDNPGIIRCLFLHDGDFPEFGRIWKAAAHEWNMLVCHFLEENTPIPSTQAEQMAYVLGAMTEGVFFQYLIRHTEDLFDLGREPEDIAEIIAVMWYRTIFLEDPPADKLRLNNMMLSRTDPKSG